MGTGDAQPVPSVSLGCLQWGILYITQSWRSPRVELSPPLYSRDGNLVNLSQKDGATLESHGVLFSTFSSLPVTALTFM